MIAPRLLVVLTPLLGFSAAGVGQDLVGRAVTKPAPPLAERGPVEPPPGDEDRIAEAVSGGRRLLLERQEGPERSEWPYQGVYRVRPTVDDPESLIEGVGRRRSVIPIGYRVGGTAIAGRALARGLETDEGAERRAALERARVFVVGCTDHPLMSPKYDGGYDVRGWGYIYALGFLLDLRERGLVPEAAAKATDEAIEFYIGALHAIEIPQTGGWNYARRGPLDRVDAVSPFMTPPGIQALVEATRQGFPVPDGIVDRAVAGLELTRGEDGYVAYAARRPTRESAAQLPGAVGRMLAVATVRSELGLADDAEVREAFDAFVEHWNQLRARKGRQGTHQPPYGVAPYYFMYAHGYAAEAVERLPAVERPARRAQLRRLLMSVHDGDEKGWNDRVFERSSAYGTSIALLALTQPEESARSRRLPETPLPGPPVAPDPGPGTSDMP
ncbi:MAG: hypothetical protein VX672_09935 [Planctomycetota bacterium]|nr:hypothetical protein [Planctomycetota bacterium]